MTIHEKLIALCAGAAIASSSTASAADGPVGSVQIDSGALSVLPAVSYAAMQVTVSGENLYWQKIYGPGEAVSVSAAETGPLPDGDYGYEFIASPEVDVSAWEAAEDDEATQRVLEHQEQANTYRQGGSFQVVGGQMIGFEEEESVETISNLTHRHDDTGEHAHEEIRQ